MKEHIRAALDELHQHGVTGRVEGGRRHPRVVFKHAGQHHRIITASSPRCPWMAAVRIRADVRRILRATVSA